YSVVPSSHALSASCLHDALPIYSELFIDIAPPSPLCYAGTGRTAPPSAASVPTACQSLRTLLAGLRQGASKGQREACSRADGERSEEHTSELQSRENLVCRLLLE